MLSARLARLCPWPRASASFAALGRAPPRLAKRLAYALLYSWLLCHRSGALERGLAAAVFLLWLCWDARVTREAHHRELDAERKVARFADGASRYRVDLTRELSFTDSEGAVRFEKVRRSTHCAFAARAVVWGNDWDGTLAEDGNGDALLAANVARCLPRFYRFCLEVSAGKPLDAFVFEIRGQRFGADLQSFARAVRHVMAGLSAGDPACKGCFTRDSVGKRGWYFQFARESFFVTTFAPCYPSSHPRYQFGAHPDSCFVLFQPEESFLRHNLPDDKPRSATKWRPPYGDVRDRIRATFKRNGREYRIPETTAYPPAEFIVAPLDQLADPPVEFWKSA